MTGKTNDTELRAPVEGTLERWAFDYLRSDSLAYKLGPPPLPTVRAMTRVAMPALRPGRPAELCVRWDKYKAPRTTHALRSPQKRAHLLHTFCHHELQAAELMCWAVLAFPNIPDAMARGLLNVCCDEIRHMRMYRAHIRQLGFELGSFAVRDWFWERAPHAQSELGFLALMGLGFEAGNLDHSQRYEAMFAEAGDTQASALMRVVGEEEVSHVAFAAHWFRELTGGLAFERWLAALPPPLSPMVMRGKPLHRERRLRAGLDELFLQQLEAWQPASPGG